MSEQAEAEARSPGLCAAHGLRYDPSQHSGCVVCRREAAPPTPVPPARPVWTRTTRSMLALACVLALALLYDMGGDARELIDRARVFIGLEPPPRRLPRASSARAVPAAAPQRAVGAVSQAHAVVGADKPSRCTLSAQGLDTMSDVAAPAAEEILRAAARGDVVTLQQEVSLGARIDARDAGGRTALCWAAATGHADAARALLDAHANPNLVTNEDVTPLMLAAGGGVAQLVQLLIERGARPGAVDQHARTALMHAARANRADAISMLLGHGALLETRCERGMTALHHAAEGSACIDALQRLLAARANIDALDMRGASALMLAAHTGHVDVVSSLLDRGARIDLRDNQGLSVIDYVVMPRDDLNESLRKDLFSVLQLLIDHDPDPRLGLDAAETPILFRKQLDDWARSRARPPLAAYAPHTSHLPPATRPDDSHGAVLMLRALRSQSRSLGTWPYQEASFIQHGLLSRAPNIVQQVRISSFALRSGQQLTLSGDLAGNAPWEVDDVLLIERYQGFERVGSAFVGPADAMTLGDQPVRRIGAQAARYTRGAVDFSPWLATGSGADNVVVSVLDFFGGSTGSTDVYLHVIGPHAASTAQGARIEALHPNLKERFLDAQRRMTWLLGCLLFVLSSALLVRHTGDIAALFHAGAAESARAPAAPPTLPPLRVLFIGNSLTNTNDMPAMVARLAQAANQPRRFEYAMDTPGGWGFSEHAQSGRIAPQLRRGWDSVVLQEQGQRLGWGAEQRERGSNVAARTLDQAIRAAGAKTVFYLTPARRDGDPENYAADTYDAMQVRVATGYGDLARELNAALVPAGTIWAHTFREQPALRLWAEDGQHPSTAGSYLVACAFYAHFYRDSPLGNPYRADLDLAVARELQADVAEVMLSWRHPAPAAPAAFGAQFGSAP